jgi:hypothetical protein
MHGRRAGPDDERLGRELAQRVDAGIAKQPTIRQLTVPGIGMITVAVFLAQTGTARGDINRFTSSQRLVGYLALDLRVRQSGNGPVTPAHQQRRRRRRPTRPRRSGTDRDPLLRPLRAFYQRIRARRGHPIAIVATARKMPSCSGTYSSANGTTPTPSQLRSPRRSARSSSKRATRASGLAATATPSTASNDERSNARSPSTLKPPTNKRRRLATTRPDRHEIDDREDLSFHPSRHDNGRGATPIRSTARKTWAARIPEQSDQPTHTISSAPSSTSIPPRPTSSTGARRGVSRRQRRRTARAGIRATPRSAQLRPLARPPTNRATPSPRRRLCPSQLSEPLRLSPVGRTQSGPSLQT